MIELSNDQLTLSCPETHPDARLIVEFQRTLRIPDGDRDMPRLPCLGRYPLYSVTEHRRRVPAHWLEQGGAMLPMYQSEAMWLSLLPAFSVAHRAFYPFAVKIRVGAIDAVRGGRWSEGLYSRRHDYLIVQEQSWLGGFQTREGIRQFVAMPLGSGYLPEDGTRSPTPFGSLEIIAYPMSASAFEMRFPRRRWRQRRSGLPAHAPARPLAARRVDLGPDALERQPIEEGLFPFGDWDRSAPVRYILRLANSLHWCAITCGPPPMSPTRARTERHHSAAIGTAFIRRSREDGSVATRRA